MGNDTNEQTLTTPRCQTKPKRDKEATEVGQAVSRLLRALVRRAGAGDLVAIEELWRIREEAQLATAQAIEAAHVGPAQYSYGRIAWDLDVSRQGARQLALRRAREEEVTK